jgi:hypothetical protein
MRLGATEDLPGLTSTFEAHARLENLRFARHDWGAYEYRYEFTIDLPQFNQTRDVAVFWSPLRPHAPITHMPGKACRRHRNVDRYRSLCLWYPEDPPDKRWCLEGGLRELRDLTVVHAFCEECCSRGGKWLKPEAPKPHSRPEGCRACPDNWQSCP